MSNNLFGEKIRFLREQSELPLRKVAAELDIDVAVLSKLERGERRVNKDLVIKFAKIYNHDVDELLILFLSDKIVYEIQNEELAEVALQVAEKRVKYLKTTKHG